jgi:hypothetical protein
MATTYKVLGQVLAASSNAYGTLYNPSGVSAVVSSIVVSNQSTSPATYSIAIMGAASSPTAPDATLLCAGITLPANTTTSYTLGVTLEAGKFIRVSASSTSVGFQAFGSEIS